MRRECREPFPRHRLQRKPLVSDPGMHHGTCITHVPWCMSGSLTHGGGENVPGIPGACTTLRFTYLTRGPCSLFPGMRNGFGPITHFSDMISPRSPDKFILFSEMACRLLSIDFFLDNLELGSVLNLSTDLWVFSITVDCFILVGYPQIV